jgi:hypothetical protein
MSKLRAVLFLSGSDAPVDEVPLIDIGVDSLVGVEIRAWCLKEVGVDVPVMKILGGISLNGIVGQVLDSLLEPEVGDEQRQVEPQATKPDSPLAPGVDDEQEQVEPQVTELDSLLAPEVGDEQKQVEPQVTELEITRAQTP